MGTVSTNLNANLDTLFGKMENFITTKTVVGEAIHIGDIIIVPMVDVSFGVAAGAADSEKEKDAKETSGGGLGGKITPSAVLVITGDNVQLVNIKNQDSINKLIDMAPGLLSKVGSFFKKKDEEDIETAEDDEDNDSPFDTVG